MRQAFVAVLAGLLLAGCATTERLSAANDVHALMIAIRDDDQPAFDAHVGRRALEAQIQARIVARAAAPGSPEAVKGLGLILSGPLARAAAGLLIQPEVFRAVADYYGYKPSTPIPGTFAIAHALRPLPDGRVCAVTRRRGNCLVTFANEDGIWRLVSFDGNAGMLRLR
ncbi:MAG: DUF2939 domain-containing protein [Caulobacteraceae bacterium]